MSFDQKVVLITGGAGSIGRALTRRLLNDCVPRVVRVLDINEAGLHELSRSLNGPNFRAFLGDIRDKERLKRALQNVDVIFHLAAYKFVDLLENNPWEAVSTNVLGTENVIECAIDANVEKMLNMSTDKSTQFSSTYGAAKFLSERLIIDANNWKGDARTIFANARPVNVPYSNGSVHTIWEKDKSEGKPLPVTHPQATRFFLSMDKTVDFLLKCIELMKGGEIFVPNTGVEEVKIIDLAKKLSDNIKITGLRKGEKLHELLMDPSEEERAEMINGIWIIR